MNYRVLLVCLIGALALSSCSAARSLGQTATRVGQAVTRSIR